MFHFSKWNGSGEDRRQGDHTLYQLSFWGVLARDTLNWEERSSLTDFMCLNTFNKQTVFIFMGGEYRGSCNYMYFFFKVFFWPFMALLKVQLKRRQETGWERGGVTCSKGTQARSLCTWGACSTHWAKWHPNCMYFWAWKIHIWVHRNKKKSNEGKT